MKINGKHYRTIWPHSDDPACIRIIDQRWLPHRFVVEDLRSVEDMATAISDMHLRGAPLIGSAAAYGIYLALAGTAHGRLWEEDLQRAAALLKATRPTAVNLARAVDAVVEQVRGATDRAEAVQRAFRAAGDITEQSVEHCRRIGEEGLPLIEKISRRKNGEPVNILTHCNAGWLACIDYGTATAPIYAARDSGIPVHVWVDETRPRNQGARITAFELLEHGVPHTVVADNTGGHLMQHGLVDLVLTGTDRTTRQGDVANKIGTYLKALAARDNGIPFYVGLPSSSIDWEIEDGLSGIPIEQRSGEEVRSVQGMADGRIIRVRIAPEGSPVANYAFDVTPARLVTGLITERGVCEASEKGLLRLFPEFSKKI
ncbi:MAG TPA: S-methyl-5-thioribose-1-phosphate isomerase [Bacteroidetes bacterium]|nr:S-methyl-5-thioribose-1-phosphate isomerase [Bacteroidota bacterium]